jgi:hypothetical protein
VKLVGDVHDPARLRCRQDPHREEAAQGQVELGPHASVDPIPQTLLKTDEVAEKNGQVRHVYIQPAKMRPDA